MGFPTAQILDLIYQLLPGFLAAWIFYGLTAHPKKDSFERSVQALIFTGIVKGIVISLHWLAIWIGRWKWLSGIQLYEWSADGEYVLSIALGVAVGFIFSYYANTSKFHSFIRKKLPELTKRTSYPSEWFSAFNGLQRYVILHLDREFLHFKDEDKDVRVFGWPEEWPDSPETGHFVLMQAEWMSEDNTRTPLPETERLLIPAKAVLMVELMIEYVPQAVTTPAAEVDADASEKESEDNTPTPLPDTDRLVIPSKAVLTVELTVEYGPQAVALPVTQVDSDASEKEKE